MYVCVYVVTVQRSPIKAISGFLGVPSYYWGFLYLAMMLVLIYANLADVIYRCTRVFLHSILSISFKSIEIVGLDNIPREGPIIFTGNHANQFVDGLVVMMTSPRKVRCVVVVSSCSVLCRWRYPYELLGNCVMMDACSRSAF